jgi:hypothetical protein
MNFLLQDLEETHPELIKTVQCLSEGNSVCEAFECPHGSTSINSFQGYGCKKYTTSSFCPIDELSWIKSNEYLLYLNPDDDNLSIRRLLITKAILDRLILAR